MTVAEDLARGVMIEKRVANWLRAQGCLVGHMMEEHAPFDLLVSDARTEMVERLVVDVKSYRCRFEDHQAIMVKAHLIPVLHNQAEKYFAKPMFFGVWWDSFGWWSIHNTHQVRNDGRQDRDECDRERPHAFYDRQFIKVLGKTKDLFAQPLVLA